MKKPTPELTAIFIVATIVLMCLIWDILKVVAVIKYLFF